MTKNELIVESCRNMAFQDLRDTLSSALDNRDATIAALRAEVERLKATVAELRQTNRELMGIRAVIGHATIDAMREEITQLREDRRVLANECEAWRLASGNKPEDVGDRWKALYVTGGEWRWQPLAAADATDASGALGRAT